MAENQKNLCAMIPAELHSRVRTAQEQAGMTLSAYITELLTNYYEGGTEKMEKGMRRLKHCNLSTIPKKCTKTHAP